METSEEHLSRSLGPFSLWGLGVGYVISGMYFGWSLGLPQGGTLGLAIATFFITIMYASFTLGYCELACAIPKAGGAFDYATVALGPYWGFLAGIAQIIEFVFAPPAIAAAIGAYFGLFFSSINPLVFSIIAYFIFTGLNVYGVKASASFELVITLVAVLILLIFAGATLPHFHLQNLGLNSFPHGISGIFLAIPFAIWFFLGIEGVANMAEETINPQKNVMLGFISAMLTEVVLCLIIFTAAVGVGGWEKIVFSGSSPIPSDSPLPLALGQIINHTHFLFHFLVSMSLVGLIASFNGIILAAGRATFEFGRVGYAPKRIGTVHPKFKTPAWALFCNMIIGILALFTGKTAEIITIACFGALSLYAISMVSLFQLKKTHPKLVRPFRTPFYPYAPLAALLIALASLVVMTIYNLKAAFIYFGILTLALLWFKLTVTEKEREIALSYET